MRPILIILLCMLSLPAYPQQRTAKSDGFKGNVKNVVATYMMVRPYKGSCSVTETWYDAAGLATRSIVHHFVVKENDTVGRSGEDLYFKNGRPQKHVHYNIDSGKRILTTTDLYRYDTKGRKILHTQQDIRRLLYKNWLPDTVVKRAEYFYDSKDREVLQYVYEGYGEDPPEKKYMYVTNYSDDGKWKYEYSYSYDYDGKCSFGLSYIEHTDSNKRVGKLYNADHKLGDTRIDTLLEDGRMHLTETMNEDRRYPISYTFGSFDDQGNCLGYTRDAEKEIVKQIYTYTYYN